MNHMFQTSHIEISRSALQTNVKFARNLFGKDIRISSVVKANAYGHGIEQYLPLAEACGLDHFSVFSADEALRASNLSHGKSTIMVMGMLEGDAMEWAISKGIEFYVFDIDELENAISLSRRIGKKARIHVEIETGMHRTGFNPSRMSKVIDILKAHRGDYTLAGICTHYAGAENSENHDRIMSQMELFEDFSRMFDEAGLQPEYRHTACSAAALRYENTRMDMVRTGIILYGFFPSEEVRSEFRQSSNGNIDPLKRLITWKSYVMDVKSVKAGEYIGYGTAYLATADMKVAIVPVGYGYGFTRSLSNQGRVLINGKRVSVAGMVNMNMMTVDVSHVDDVARGDEVVMIGQQGDLEISVSSFGQFSDQLNYELLTRLPGDIPRRIVA
jgi:alanine racemase